MQYLVLNSYLKMKKEEKDSWKTFHKNMNLRERALMYIMVLSAIFSLVFLFYKNGQHILLAYSGILVELLAVFLLSISFKKNNIKKSSENIKKLDDEYKQIKTWLNEIGYYEKNQIKLLCIRCKNLIEKNEINNKRRNRLMEKIANFALVPLFTVFISNVFGIISNLDEMIISTILISISIVIIYIAIVGLIILFSPFLNKTYIDMENMVNMIEGMVDREFDVTDDDIKQH